MATKTNTKKTTAAATTAAEQEQALVEETAPKVAEAAGITEESENPEKALGNITNEECSEDDLPESINEAEAANPAPVSTENKVVVASNMPQAFTFNVPDRMGNLVPVTIKGNAENLRGKLKGVLPIGAYGLTTVDADAWDWIKTNYAKWPPIRNGLIFATTAKQAKGAVKERTGLRHGFEPVNPEESETKKHERVE